jgi:hypothetical protein
MATINYTQIPDLDKFKKDSSVTFGTRSSDSILMQIDAGLSQYHKAAGYITADEARLHKTLLLGRLYFSTDLWMKESAKGIGNSGRKEAIQSLFEITCISLTKLTGYAINLIPRWIDETYGKGINEHAVGLDYTDRSAQYLTTSEVDKYRVQFRNGIATHLSAIAGSTNLVPLDSASLGKATKTSRQTSSDQGWSADHAGYVLSMGGDFFCANHLLHLNKNFYHSSYLAGNPVLCAGTWLVELGKVVCISTASGHYQPTQDHLIRAVETLKANGVNMDRLIVKAHLQLDKTGTEFLKQAPIKSLAAHRKEFTQNEAALFEFKKNGLAVMDKIEIENGRIILKMADHIRNNSHVDKQGKRVEESKDCEHCRLRPPGMVEKAQALAKKYAA